MRLRNKAIVLVLSLLSLPLMAEEPVKEFTIADILEKGGPALYFIIFLSMLAIFIAFYLLFTIRKESFFPADFKREIEPFISNNDMRGLLAACEDNNSKGATAIAAMAKVLVNNPNTPYEVLRDILEDEGGRIYNTNWQKVEYLKDIAVITPMVGLLGTIFGMFHAFIGIGESVGTVQQTALASGIAEAMITTGGGLMVGIMAIILFSIFRGRFNNTISSLEESCREVLTSVNTGSVKS